jgi:hypothetical protein
MHSAAILSPYTAPSSGGVLPPRAPSALGETLAADREFTTREAAQFIGCSEGYFIKLRAANGPPYHRRYKRKGIYYLESDLMIWRRGRRYLSTSEY